MSEQFATVNVRDFTGSLSRLYDKGMPPGDSTGWAEVDRFYTVLPGLWTLVTGVPSSGKSSWLDALMVHLAKNQGWRFVVYSPENQPHEFHIISIVEKYIGKKFGAGFNNCMSKGELEIGLAFFDKHFKILRVKSMEKIPTLTEIMTEAEDVIDYWTSSDSSVTKFGVVVDPWNELDLQLIEGENETTRIGRLLSWWRHFHREHRTHGWIVAHPKQLLKDRNGQYPVPRPYDISGSAHWYNKADCCITVARNVDQQVDIHIQKVRFRHIGRQGIARLNFELGSGRYTEDRKMVCTDNEVVW